MICGWLSPEGAFYACRQYGHRSLASGLVWERYNVRETNLPDEYLLERNWIKLYSDGLIAGAFPRKGLWRRRQPAVTGEQLRWLEQQTLSGRQRDGLSVLLEGES